MKKVLTFGTVFLLLLSACSKQEEIIYNDLFLSVTKDSGFYESQTLLELKTDHQAEIYYTIDGSEPTRNSTKYEDKIILNKNTQPNVLSSVRNISSVDNTFIPSSSVDKYINFKAKAFDKFGNCSETINKIYFVGFNEDYYKNLPIVILNVDYNDLFDYENGIYVTGKTYDEGEKIGYPEEYPANYNNKGKEWERAAHFIYFDEEHHPSFEQDIGIRIHGGWTRASNQKSFNLYARKEYSGTKNFEKPFFGNKANKTVMLRNGGYRDYQITKTRDPLIQDLSSSFSFETQRSYPVILFLNNEYWGIYNLQERFSDSYINEHYGINEDNIVIIETDQIDEGLDSDINLFNDLKEFFINNDLSQEETYKRSESLIDIDSFIEYMSAELIAGNIDWPNNNYRMWRSRETGEHNKEDSKWRFMMYDTDDSTDIIPMASVDSNPFDNSSHWKYGPLDKNSTIGLIFSSLLKNEEFFEKFKNKFLSILNNEFSWEKVNNYLSQKSSLLSTPMELNYKRFVSDSTDVFNKTYYENNIRKILDFFKNRKNYLISYLDDLNNGLR